MLRRGAPGGMGRGLVGASQREQQGRLLFSCLHPRPRGTHRPLPGVVHVVGVVPTREFPGAWGVPQGARVIHSGVTELGLGPSSAPHGRERQADRADTPQCWCQREEPPTPVNAGGGGGRADVTGGAPGSAGDQGASTGTWSENSGQREHPESPVHSLRSARGTHRGRCCARCCCAWREGGSGRAVCRLDLVPVPGFLCVWMQALEHPAESPV